MKRMLAFMVLLLLALSGTAALAEALEKASVVELWTEEMAQAQSIVLEKPEPVAGSVKISGKTFPDDAFRAYVAEAFDTDGNGWLSGEERGMVTEMRIGDEENCTPVNCTGMRGIEFFPNLRQLFVLRTPLKDIDISRNVQLDFVTICFTDITSLDASKNVALSGMTVSTNKISKLTLGQKPHLKWLACDANNLTTLDVSECPELEHLQCFGNELTKLDVSENEKLNALIAYENQIGRATLGNKPRLMSLNIMKNRLTELDVSKCPELRELYVGANRLINLDVSKNTKLTSLICSQNELSELDVRKNRALVYFQCGRNNIRELNVTRNTRLKALDVSNMVDRKLERLVVKRNSALEFLDVSGNDLTFLKLSGNPMLEELICSDNRINRLDVSLNRRLRRLMASGNRLGSLLLGDSEELVSLDVSDNALKRLDVSGKKWLTTLDCTGNRLTRLDVRDCIRLATLTCTDNRLCKLAVNDFVLLEQLDCSGNCLTELDVSGCMLLKQLKCGNNAIRTLNITRDSGLQSLDCRGNQLRKLDVSECPSLSALFCQGNRLGVFDISTLPAGLYRVVSNDVLRVEDAATGTVSWRDGIDTEASFSLRITMVDGDRLIYGTEHIFSNLFYLRSNRREDYPFLSDAAFANFREVQTTGIARCVLYRGSSPLRPALRRNTQCAAAMEAAGVRTILNLSDDPVFMESLSTYPDSYYSRQNVLARKLSCVSAMPDSLAHYLPFFRFMLDHEGPYFVHCEMGRDRTGTFCAVLECLMGADGDEVAADFMETYYSFCGIRHRSDIYYYILNARFEARLNNAFGFNVAAADGDVLAARAEELLQSAGMTQEEIEALKARLAGE